MAAVIAVGLAGCDRPHADATRASGAPGASVAERGYAPAPTVTGARRLSAGRLMLSGTATPAAKVRLASPAGEAIFATSDAAGGWRFVLPADNTVRLFGLSAQVQGRPVQAEGYVAVTPSGQAAQLRAGSGSVALQARRPAPLILAVDFDRKGGAVISGQGPTAGPVTLQVDGAAPQPARVDKDGRFMLALNEPLAAGPHVLTVAGAGSRFATALTVSPAEPPTSGPFRAEPTPGGWRIDWRTPGGGVQSTVLFDRGVGVS
ncbi:MAG TPA: hypothetical protein VGI30_04930 [Caulobacteraceae bacterium]